MSTEIASQLTVTKFDITERMKPGWPRYFHYEARQVGKEFPVGYISVTHWLQEQRAEVQEISLDNSGEYGSGNTVAIGQFMLKTVARNLQAEQLPEFRVPEPYGAELSLVRDVFGADGFDVTTYHRDLWPAPSERQLIQLPADELLERCLRAQDVYDTTDDAIELWVPLSRVDMNEWPTSEIYPEPVYL